MRIPGELDGNLDIFFEITCHNELIGQGRTFIRKGFNKKGKFLKNLDWISIIHENGEKAGDFFYDVVWIEMLVLSENSRLSHRSEGQ